MTTTAGPDIIPREAASLPELRAADRGVADALEAALSDNTQRVYETQWKLFDDWCGDVGLRSPAGGAPHRRPLPGRPRQHRHPCAWPHPPSPRPTSGPATNRPAGTRACLFKGR